MIVLITSAMALPMYAQRSGRTCGNCHVSPTLEDEDGWDNPELEGRKCTMTCLSCHVDPAGGGLRNTSGRFYGASTLGIVGGQERSYSDVDREILTPGTVWKLRHVLGRPATGEGRTVPSDLDEAREGVGAGQTGNLWAMGRHPRPVRMSLWDGRYGSLNADPVVAVGGDLRAAWYSATNAVFPMQLDLHAAVHPVHHLTLAATAAGQASGSGSPVFARRAYAMVHELPGMSWARAGAFQPAFGTMLDDHTSPVRTLFEASAADSANTVIGAEVGTAPNYPFAQASVFANDASVLGAAPDTGWGAAVQGGWRDLDWSLTGHAQIRRRHGLGRGDLEAVGVGWGLSPRPFWPALPVTWLGEVTAGRRTREQDVTLPVAAMSELSFLVRNGIVAKVRSDAWFDDLQVGGMQQRHGLGLVVTPLPGLTLEGTTRMLLTPKGTVRTDALVQTHIWF
ncbi:MAG: hypothetical protein H6737_28540 [Alphaproteobacteria bacterium]|nr:hypothetical protein [Alphaproteobacteria bacterium]